MRREANVAIIGAGYAGMAAAAELATRGVAVTVFETSRVLGGRARAVDVQGATVDNGQHILIGAYRETLRLMELVGADPVRALLRQPLHLEYPGQLRVAAPDLPAPLHLAWALLGARGLGWRDKFAAIRFMQAMKAARFKLASDMTVAALLDAQRQPARLREYLWDALCVAALNTPAESASAQIFLNVLRDSLAAERAASDLLLPKVDLGKLFPDAAARYVARRNPDNAAIRRDTPIRRIERDPHNGRYTLRGANDSDSDCHGPYSHVIVAVAPYHVAALINRHPELVSLQDTLAGFRYQPIVTCYLAYPEHVTLPQPMLGYAHGIMQWLFDRGRLGGTTDQRGLFAAVISARGRHLELGHEELAARIHAEIATFVHDLPPPLWTQVITEKRATWSCTPGLYRPQTATRLPGLLLAGDYVAGDYPGTLEGAVRSGVAAAQLIA